jgi:methylated-DNA-[protein]-cysteine S-methyltransferase
MAAAADEARVTGFDAKLRTPFAVLGIRTDGESLTRVAWLPLSARASAPRTRFASRVVREIEAYLRDPSARFSIPIDTRGTPFQRRVWEAIASIPVGESRTYAEIARMVRSSARAVGGACAANHIALVVPCHRVVGSRGSLGGFMNAVDGNAIRIKRWLLAHEGYRFGA